MKENNIYKPKQFSKLVGVTVHTLQVWDKNGKLPAKRTLTDKRYYTDEDLEKVLNISIVKDRVDVGYGRVSSKKQSSNLDNQIRYISEYTNSQGIILETIYKDIGSGLNFERREWNKLLGRVSKEEIGTIYITYKDRFTRFGYEWFEKYCNSFRTKIVVLNQKQTSSEEELIQDLLSIMHVFSSRSYGLRSYRKKIADDYCKKPKNENQNE